MNSKFATAVAATAALFLAAAPPAMARDHHHDHHGGYHHHHGHHGGNFGAGIAGFAAGAILGGALASQPDYYYAPGYAYAPGRSVRWCMRHYRSYDPGSGTYLGYDGYRHACP
jgi:BA14K-like protein